MKQSVLRARVTTQLKARFEELCEEKGMDVSERLRFLLIQDLEKNKKKGGDNYEISG